MTETPENKSNDIKLYSSTAIGGATFLGGPLAAGYLIGENYKALNQPKEGKYALLIGIIATIILIGGVYMIPENIADAAPTRLIPLIYTGIILGIVEWKQGAVLKAHKENNNLFFSWWRVLGIGLISLLIMGIGIFGYVFLTTDNELDEKYDAYMYQFSQNEEESLVFYDHLGQKTDVSLLKELENNTIPKWIENIEIIKKSNNLEGLPSELRKQNDILLEYAELRLEAFKLFGKGIEEDTDKYHPRLDDIHIEIDRLLNQL